MTDGLRGTLAVILAVSVVFVVPAATSASNAPVANDQALVTDEDTPLAFALDASDPDSGDVLSRPHEPVTREQAAPLIARLSRRP